MIIKDNFCYFCIKTSHQDSSDKGSHHMVSMRNKKIYPSIITKYSSYLELWFGGTSDGGVSAP